VAAAAEYPADSTAVPGSSVAAEPESFPALAVSLALALDHTPLTGAGPRAGGLGLYASGSALGQGLV